MKNKLIEKTYLIQNRLKVIVMNKPGFLTKTALLSFPFGGLHQCYYDGEKRIPFEPGAAHFLEHKCFEDDGEEITEKFSKLGASANAFTSYTQTVYYFKTIDHFLENVKTLMDLAFRPNFTPQGIEKERGIILQEMAASHDKPFYKQYKRLMDELYQDHPFSHDIIGDEASVSSISYDTLKTLHEIYYQPEYATLILGGDESFDDVLNILETYPFNPPSKYEKATIPNVLLKTPPPSLTEMTGDVHATYGLTGFRLDVSFSTKKEEYAFYLALERALDVGIGKTSSWYETHLDKDIITDSFFHDVNLDPSVAFVMMMTQTRKKEAFLEAMHALTTADPIRLLDKEAFERLKKASIGDYILGGDSLNQLVVNRAYYVDDQLTRDDFFAMQKAMTYDDMVNAFKTFQKHAIKASVILSPNNLE